MSQYKNRFSFSIITFAYNEIGLVEFQIKKWVEQFRSAGFAFEIVFINDGSNDGTKEAIEKVKNDIPELIIIHHYKRMGVGYAVATARQYVTKDYVFWNDIDSHFDVGDLNKVYPLLLRYDIVVAYKNIPPKNIKFCFSWIKSRVNYYLIKILFLSSIKDFQFVQFFPRIFFCEGMLLESRSSFIPSECILKAKECGLNIGQIKLPYHTEYSRVRPGKCKDLKTIIKSIQDIFSFWVRWNFLGYRKSVKKFYLNRLGDSKPCRR